MFKTIDDITSIKGKNFYTKKEESTFFDHDPIVDDDNGAYFDVQNKIKLLSSNIRGCLIATAVKYTEGESIRFASTQYNTFVSKIANMPNIAVCVLPIFRFNTKTFCVSEVEFETLIDAIEFFEKSNGVYCIYTMIYDEDTKKITVRSSKIAKVNYFDCK